MKEIGLIRLDIERIYNMIKMKSKVAPNITDELLRVREKRWKKTLPLEFKAFFKENNGGIPETAIIISENLRIERFLCMVPKPTETDDGYYDIDAVISQYDSYMAFSEDSVGADLIPFAQLNYDNYLCLCYKDRNNPMVAIWNREKSRQFKPYIEKYSDDFHVFLKTIGL